VHERGKQAIMKSEAEDKDTKVEVDFYDWWDSYESRMKLMQSMPRPTLMRENEKLYVEHEIQKEKPATRSTSSCHGLSGY